MSNDSRAGFERVASEIYGRDMSFHKYCLEYCYEKTENAWKVWQARDAEVAELRSKLADCKRESESLAMSMHRNYYSESSPYFELCDEPAAVITQIDNMVAGISQDNAELRAENERLKQNIWNHQHQQACSSGASDIEAKSWADNFIEKEFWV